MVTLRLRMDGIVAFLLALLPLTQFDGNSFSSSGNAASKSTTINPITNISIFYMDGCVMAYEVVLIPHTCRLVLARSMLLLRRPNLRRWRFFGGDERQTRIAYRLNNNRTITNQSKTLSCCSRTTSKLHPSPYSHLTLNTSESLVSSSHLRIMHISLSIDEAIENDGPLQFGSSSIRLRFARV